MAPRVDTWLYNDFIQGLYCGCRLVVFSSLNSLKLDLAGLGLWSGLYREQGLGEVLRSKPLSVSLYLSLSLPSSVNLLSAFSVFSQGGLETETH